MENARQGTVLDRAANSLPSNSSDCLRGNGLDAKDIADYLKNNFARFDSDSSGSISRLELEQMIRSPVDRGLDKQVATAVLSNFDTIANTVKGDGHGLASQRNNDGSLAKTNFDNANIQTRLTAITSDAPVADKVISRFDAQAFQWAENPEEFATASKDYAAFIQDLKQSKGLEGLILGGVFATTIGPIVGGMTGMLAAATVSSLVPTPAGRMIAGVLMFGGVIAGAVAGPALVLYSDEYSAPWKAPKVSDLQTTYAKRKAMLDSIQCGGS